MQMTRRAFLGAVAGTLPAAGPRRPNILFIMSDDHAAHAIGAYGSKINRTPQIDRIGREGMRFDNCFATNSVCTPSRATILTGQYSHRNGVRTLDDRLSPDQPTFPMSLRQAGYHTGVVGKWHVGNRASGFDFWSILPGQGKYFHPDFIEMGKPVRREGYVTDLITGMALEFLERRPRDKPFCLLLHHKAPHDMWQYDGRHAGLYKADVPEPSNFNDDYASRGNAIRQAQCKIGAQLTSFAEQTAQLPVERRRSAQYQIFIKSYLRCIASIDDNVGRVLDYLDSNRLAEDTVVVYTSDQGVFTGEHGLFDKRFMYEESIRMPLLVRYPREVSAGSVSSGMVLNVDFAQTLLDLGGAPRMAGQQGRSFRPLLQGRRPRDWRTSMYYRYWMNAAHFNIPAHLGIRTERYKLIHYYGQTCGTKGSIERPWTPEWELFDLKQDPHEMRNLYAEPQATPVVRRLEAELSRLQRDVGDVTECG
jgi:arylsulfatase A-like enzyme